MIRLRAHFLCISGIVFLMLAFAPLVRPQQADQDPAPATPRRADPNRVPQPHANETRMPASGPITTHESKTFSGNIVREDGTLVLQDPVTKVSYKLSDQGKAKRYLGKQVKVTGKLEINSNTIQVSAIEPRS